MKKIKKEKIKKEYIKILFVYDIKLINKLFY